MRAQAFIDEPQRVLLFETIKYRDELVKMMVMLGATVSHEGNAKAGRILRGEES